MTANRLAGILSYIASMVLCLCLDAAHAGEVTTDNLTVTQTATVYRAFTCTTNVQAPTDGLLLYYSFGVNGSNGVPDDSGNGNTGTVYNATYSNEVIKGGCYFFGGTTSNFIDITQANLASLSTSSWTMSAFVHVHSFTTSDDYPGIIVANGEGLVIKGHSLGILHGSTAYFDASDDLATNTWYHVAAVYDGGTKYLYRDLVTVGTPNSNAGWSLGSKYYVGRGFGNAAYTWLWGMVDEVRIYNRALSSSELYVLRSHVLGPVGAGSVRFEDGVNYVAPLGDISMGSYTNGP